MERDIKSSHKLLTDYTSKGKAKTIITGWIIYLFIYTISLLPFVENTLLEFSNSVNIKWVTGIVDFFTNGLWILFIPILIFSLVEILKKQTFDTICIYDNGIGFYNSENNNEKFEEYSKITLRHGAMKESFWVEAKKVDIKQTNYYWNEFENPDILENNLQRYAKWS